MLRGEVGSSPNEKTPFTRGGFLVFLWAWGVRDHDLHCHEYAWELAVNDEG